MKNEALFRTGSVWKSIFSMAVPSIIIILVMVLYNMADMFFVGCLGDTAQVAAVSVVGPVFSILAAVATMLGAELKFSVPSSRVALARVRSSRARSAPRSASGPAFFWAFWSASVCWWAECRFWGCWAPMQKFFPMRSGIFRFWHWVHRVSSCPTAWRCWCVQRAQ